MADSISPHRSNPMLFIFVPIGLAWAAWRFSAILRKRYEKKKASDDWTASLWTSPILKNPESFFFVGGLSFLAAAAMGFLRVSDTRGFEMLALEATFGIGILFSLVIFRLRVKRANQTPEPTPLLVTDRADARSAPSKGVAHL
jgi:hypothetical protein